MVIQPLSTRLIKPNFCFKFCGSLDFLDFFHTRISYSFHCNDLFYNIASVIGQLSSKYAWSMDILGTRKFESLTFGKVAMVTSCHSLALPIISA